MRAGELIGGADRHDWRTRTEANYAYLSWWRPGVAATRQQQGDEPSLSGLAIENVFDFIPSWRWPVHFGAIRS